jgi:hypothetical protein
MTTKNCLECLKPFEARGSQKCCSPECSKARLVKYETARAGQVRGPSIRTAYKRTDTLDPHFWKSIDTPEKCWLLGFLATDGNICKDPPMVRFHIQEQDKEVLELIQKLVGNVSRIHTTKTGVLLNICSAEWCRDLTKLGLGPAKSITVPWTETLYPWDYIRGLWDGDGHFHWVGTTPVAEFYSSSWALILGLHVWLAKKANFVPDLKEKSHTDTAKHYRLRLNVADTRALTTQLYTNPCLTIQRKQGRALHPPI